MKLAKRSSTRSRTGPLGVLCVLLVDSEDPVPSELPKPLVETPEEREVREHADAQARKDYLVQRDHWELNGYPPEQIHLMVQCMETWIVADPDGLRKYYKKNFHPERLPVRSNLEDEPKDQVALKFAAATRETGKEYAADGTAKGRHSGKILSFLSAGAVAKRCPRFATFTAWLGKRIAEV